MTLDIAKKRVRIKRTKPYLTTLTLHASSIDEYGVQKFGGTNHDFRTTPIRWQNDGQALFRVCIGNFIVTITSAKIKRWPRNKSTKGTK